MTRALYRENEKLKSNYTYQIIKLPIRTFVCACLRVVGRLSPTNKNGLHLLVGQKTCLPCLAFRRGREDRCLTFARLQPSEHYFSDVWTCYILLDIKLSCAKLAAVGVSCCWRTFVMVCSEPSGSNSDGRCI